MPLTSVEGASPANPADSLAWGVCVWCGGDQVVVHITVEACLLGWALLLHLKEIRHHTIKQTLNSDESKQLGEKHREIFGCQPKMVVLDHTENTSLMAS